MPRPPLELVGKRFGRLIVVSESVRHRTGRRRVKCNCDCGSERSVDPRLLVNGKTRSCGCLQKDIVSALCIAKTTHGMSSSSEYESWAKLKSRCTNPNDPKFPSYGGRGIKADPRWVNSFEAFLLDMGPKPGPGFSIDRIDNDRGYDKSNCRWADAKTQSRNRRKTIRVLLNGLNMPLSEACEISGVNYRSALYRIKQGGSWNAAIDALPE